MGNGLVNFTYYKISILVVETRSKVQKLQINDKIINSIVYGSKLLEIIDKELSILDIHQTLTYTSLPLRQKVINCK